LARAPSLKYIFTILVNMTPEMVEKGLQLYAKKVAAGTKGTTYIRRTESRLDGSLKMAEYTPEHRRWAEIFERAGRELKDTYARLLAEEKFYEKAVASWKRTDTYDESTAGSRFYLASPLPSTAPALDQVMARLRALDD